jgi:hypothetical protein
MSSRTDYLQAVCDSQVSPVEVIMKQQQDPGFSYIVDVRVGPQEFKGGNCPLSR